MARRKRLNEVKPEDDPCWVEALRRTAERGGCPEEHLQAMMQEVIDEQLAEGIIETAGLNEHGKMVYHSHIAPAAKK